MDRELPKKIAQWLWTKNRVKEAQPVVVEIGGRVYPATRYVEVQKGGYHQTRLYLLGELPPLQSKRRLCYRTDPDSEDVWHLVAWFRQNRHCPEWSEVHPFGSHFVLALYMPLQTWAEECLGKPLYRIPMTVTEVGPPLSNVTEKHDERS